MAFTSGRVTFCRFRVEGNAPLVADQNLLDHISAFKFTESPIGAPDEIECGWVTGEHLFDTQFSYEKNCFGDIVLLAMRMDTNKIPADVKRAYKLMNEAALASDNPSGFVSKNQRREAADLAARQAHEDLASGKYRKSKMIPVLWDLRRNALLCGAAGNAVTEQLQRLFRTTFELELTLMTSGSLAGELMREKGGARDFEDLRPSGFTPPPAQAQSHADDAGGARDLQTPHVPWAQASVDMKDFLGNEMLIWLWHRIETQEGLVPVKSPSGGSDLALVMIKSLEMECAWEATGKQSLSSDAPTRLPEAGEALAEGKWPRKVGLILADTDGGEGQSYELTLQGDRMIVSSAQLPAVEDVQHPRELTEHRLLAVRGLCDRLDQLFTAFLEQRLSSKWSSQRTHIRQWIAARLRRRRAVEANTPVANTPDADTAAQDAVASAADIGGSIHA